MFIWLIVDKEIEHIVAEFKEAFPEPIYELFVQEGDWKREIGMGISNTKTGKRHAVMLKGVKTISGVMGWNPQDSFADNSPLEWKAGPPWKQKAIGILASDDVEKEVKNTITQLKSIIG